MTRFAGDGNVSNLRVTGRKSGRVFYLQARRIRSQAQARREAAIKTWITQLPYGLQQLCLSDVTELLGFLPHLPEQRVKDFFYEAQGHLHNYRRCADGDEAQARNLDLFHCCIVDALLADAEAAGR